MLIIRLILESFRFAWNALRMNLLRTTLSLLGVTIGIFAIIAVFTLVDSLERSIKDSLNFLGTNNINVEKWPYGFGGGPYPWWKYLQRPHPTFDEYEFLQENVKNAKGISIFAVRGGITAKYNSSSSMDLDLVGVVHGHKDVYEIPIIKGRYFTPQEDQAGRNVVILGHRPASELFPDQNPIGKEIKVRGLKYYVIGVIKEEGDSFLGAPTNDENIYLPYKSFLKVFYSGQRRGVGSRITVKGLDKDIGLVELEAELRGLMRKKRALKPKEEDNFALNRPEAIANFIGSTFDVIGLAGWVIGGFSILVGGFGIANIMFVSVRERTNIIGIQKSLGAKNYFILFQFLFESVFLSVLGGGFGILMVWLLSFISLGSLELVLSFSNIALGLGVSAIIGMASGIIPAAMAARLDPVIAIRTQ
ncbi:ABC transporter permease [Marinoscillum furvescens]|uniref:Putative ABC transport system permease protein n=1 Tax=Marinoscillum furvescens DSM 4134 TaxID=1122208 RepID=A0A3D9KXP7_MARFU|nr:ABC transporter permease [Marinoscillum furvescens]RED92802.1 putative ABC transport system permease protein [Marinoscillum furvescens DSM 4134]